MIRRAPWDSLHRPGPEPDASIEDVPLPRKPTRRQTSHAPSLPAPTEELAERIAAQLSEDLSPRFDALEAALNAGPTIAPVLTAAQVAEVLSVSPRFVWTLVEEGQLTPFRLSARTTRFSQADVERLIQSRIAQSRRGRKS